MKSAIKTLLTVLLASATLLAIATPASAITETLYFSEFITGPSLPDNSPPWLKATFTDVSGGVELTLTPLSLNGTENVKDVWFTLNPSLNSSDLDFDFVSKVGSLTDPTISLGNNTQNSPGGLNFDIRLAFASGGNIANTFTQGDSITYFIDGIASLDVLDFVLYSTGGYAAAAHIQNTGAGDSVTVGAEPVPEASNVIGASLLIFGLMWKERSRIRGLFARKATVV